VQLITGRGFAREKQPVPVLVARHIYTYTRTNTTTMSSQYPANYPQTDDGDGGGKDDSYSRLRWKGPQDVPEGASVPASPVAAPFDEPEGVAAAGGAGAAGGEARRTAPVKRASILKKPGAERSKTVKRASIDLSSVEPRSASSSEVAAARASPVGNPLSGSSHTSGSSSSPSGASAAAAAAAAAQSPKPRVKRRTIELGFLGKKSQSDSQISEASEGRTTMPTPPSVVGKEKRTISVGLPFRSRSSQNNSDANLKDSSEAETAASRRHQRNRSMGSVVSSGASTGGASRVASSSATGHGSTATTTIISRCCWRCKTCVCPQLPKPVTDWINQRLINTKAWQAFIILFTIVLLFGAQIQDLWCPPSSDVAFDVIFTCAFVFLIVDVILRSAADPTYFILNLCGRDLRSPHGEHSPNRVDALCGLRSIFQFGSFMFWCDLLSTLSLLWDISYINPFRSSMLEVTIGIDDLGIPESGTGLVNEASPIQITDALAIEVLIAIVRTLRVSRFIKTSAVVKISSKVNWYWLPDRVNPHFWFRKYCGKSNNEEDGGGGGGGGGGILSEMSDSAPMVDLGSFRRSSMSVEPSGRFARRSSFSSTGSGAYDEARAARAIVVNHFLLKFGVKNRRIREFEREYAATRIQRAWREYCEVTGKNRGQPTRNSAISKKSSKLESVKKTVMRKRSSTTTSAPVDAEAKKESQVGSAMRELTGQRVAVGIVIALVVTVLFTYSEINSTSFATMIVLHEQTQDVAFKNVSIDAARNSTVPELFSYTDANGDVSNYALGDGTKPHELRNREIMSITIADPQNMTTEGLFDIRQTRYDSALVELIDTIFILIIWFFGVTAFAGPVMVLVVTPIERMIRLLSMLMKDPLGFQGTSRYKKFVAEEDSYTKNTKWTKDLLKGMETSFLMSTILRIGSLMKVGFGAAGVEIIRNNLAKGESKDGLVLNTQGTTVQCIFLFCDIRQFTDATESLQEEVFVFTNKIASVIHSICNSCGGSANKNVGDAFLMSWLLDDEAADGTGAGRRQGPDVRNTRGPVRLTRSQIKADSALLAVVKICIALYYDKFFLEDMTDAKRGRLMKKIAKRMGPVVQMGFGLHCGKAVQGAIGTQRKLDATYVSDAVEFAEFLESSTKQYGVKMLMSDAFHDLLSPQAGRRCRKVDQILIVDDDMDPDDPDLVEIAEKVELYTYDMDIDELWKHRSRSLVNALQFGGLDATDHSMPDYHPNIAGTTVMRATMTTSQKSRRDIFGKRGAPSGAGATNADGPVVPQQSVRQSGRRRASLLRPRQGLTNVGGLIGGDGSGIGLQELDIDYGLNERGVPIKMPELTLPSGKTKYSLSSWNTEDMRIIRKKYSDGLFFQQFNAALRAYYSGDWKRARETFSVILERFEDGPSRYFLGQIESHNGIPPRKFLGYNVV